MFIGRRQEMRDLNAFWGCDHLSASIPADRCFDFIVPAGRLLAHKG